MSKQRRRALVVEKDPAILRLIARVLNREQFHVVEAADGATAVRHLQRSDGFELVVLDVDSKAENAAHVIECLKARFPSALRRVIVISGASEIIKHGLPEAVCVIIPKPFDLQAFIAATKQCAD
jgi:DNA-binding response OmpR family regulator